jgi:hypothetical protein
LSLRCVCSSVDAVITAVAVALVITVSAYAVVDVAADAIVDAAAAGDHDCDGDYARALHNCTNHTRLLLHTVQLEVNHTGV